MNRLKNDEREFNSRVSLCKSELAALKTIYNIKYSYSTQKVYSLELQTQMTIILDEI